MTARWQKFSCMILISSLMAVGCVTNTTTSTGPSPSAQAKTTKKNNDGRTQEMKKWIGQKVEQLTAEMGQPANTLDATLLGRPPAEAFVYPDKEGQGCMDAFVVQENNGEITDYFCR